MRNGCGVNTLSMRCEAYNKAMQTILPDQIVQALREVLPEVQAIYLFGSRQTQRTHAESDLDIAVLMPRRMDPVIRFAAQNKLAWKFNIEVDPVDLRTASTVMNYEVIRTGARLFCTNRPECTDYEALQISLYFRLNEERKEILESIKASASQKS